MAFRWRFNPRRVGAAAGVGFGLLVGFASLDWYWTGRQLDAGLRDWAERGKIAGWSFTYARATHGGWPLAATLTLSDVELKATHGSLPVDLTWNADRVILQIKLTAPSTLGLETQGIQRLRLWDWQEILFTAERLTAYLPLGIDPSVEYGIEATSLRAAIPLDQDHSGTLSMAAISAELGLTTAGTGSARVSISAEKIGLPPQFRWPLGPDIANFALESALDGPMPPLRDLASAAAAWRDGGGSMEVQKLALTWGPLNVQGTATLALDEQLQPMGAGSGKLIGYMATLDALSGNGVLSRSAVTAAKAVLALLADAPAEGEQAEVEVPVTLQYRTLSMRQIPLLRLPELDWPGQ